MVNLARDSDTICAICTPPGTGGIAVIRVSGPLSLSVSRSVCPFLPERPESHRVYYGLAIDKSSGEKLDEVLATYFSLGKSFTGEETVEISCHGGPVVTGSILQAIIEAGSRLAERGEFTYRAFCGGRIDLVQAEGVLSLIEANSKRAANLALRQLRGSLSEYAMELENSLHWVLANLEANIDFAYEDIESASNVVLVDRLKLILEGAKKAVASYGCGRLLQEGMQIALVGKTNVGKSSLLNSLIGEDKSIVTSVPGTTRDQVEGSFLLDGIRVNLVDTAGLRETADQVELLGIERTKKLLKTADLVWLVVDLSSEPDFKEVELIGDLGASRMWVIGSKSDLVPKSEARGRLHLWWKRAKDLAQLEWSAEPKLVIGSSFSDDGLDEIWAALHQCTVFESCENSVVLAQARHYELFKKIALSLERGLDLLMRNESPDFIAFELREALFGLHELLGKQFDDEILDRVFSEFCLGK
ncbi:MAG: tRNA uridine-5-carboxymethylaminomethyl(34) synthesis GTPase MnmE [Bdellovibrionales bacterium]|nr:tRNA uridine-5-carboxymethylaminomethyl(34) synthesis GTPase MnmE [Bdellovibrionales bacterium]